MPVTTQLDRLFERELFPRIDELYAGSRAPMYRPESAGLSEGFLEAMANVDLGPLEDSIFALNPAENPNTVENFYVCFREVLASLGRELFARALPYPDIAVVLGIVEREILNLYNEFKERRGVVEILRKKLDGLYARKKRGEDCDEELLEEMELDLEVLRDRETFARSYGVLKIYGLGDKVPREGFSPFGAAFLDEGHGPGGVKKIRPAALKVAEKVFGQGGELLSARAEESLERVRAGRGNMLWQVMDDVRDGLAGQVPGEFCRLMLERDLYGKFSGSEPDLLRKLQPEKFALAPDGTFTLRGVGNRQRQWIYAIIKSVSPDRLESCKRALARVFSCDLARVGAEINFLLNTPREKLGSHLCDLLQTVDRTRCETLGLPHPKFRSKDPELERPKLLSLIYDGIMDPAICAYIRLIEPDEWVLDGEFSPDDMPENILRWFLTVSVVLGKNSQRQAWNVAKILRAEGDYRRVCGFMRSVGRGTTLPGGRVSRMVVEVFEFMSRNAGACGEVEQQDGLLNNLSQGERRDASVLVDVVDGNSIRPALGYASKGFDLAKLTVVAGGNGEASKLLGLGGLDGRVRLVKWEELVRADPVQFGVVDLDARTVGLPEINRLFAANLRLADKAVVRLILDNGVLNAAQLEALLGGRLSMDVGFSSRQSLEQMFAEIMTCGAQLPELPASYVFARNGRLSDLPAPAPEVLIDRVRGSFSAEVGGSTAEFVLARRFLAVALFQLEMLLASKQAGERELVGEGRDFDNLYQLCLDGMFDVGKLVDAQVSLNGGDGALQMQFLRPTDLYRRQMDVVRFFSEAAAHLATTHFSGPGRARFGKGQPWLIVKGRGFLLEGGERSEGRGDQHVKLSRFLPTDKVVYSWMGMDGLVFRRELLMEKLQRAVVDFLRVRGSANPVSRLRRRA